ncbi:MAG: hypothetical protein JWR80_4145 [Bradyrhizobium sp.]|nr:hypothetical protein [Bradyrhizobium sp.]
MDRLDLVQIFVRVVESGSFTAVARELGVGQPAISKQLAALEAHLGGQLIRRSTRTLSLTEAGRDFYESSVRLLEDFEAATSRVSSGQTTPKGLVRVMTSPTFGRLYITPHLNEFFARYPDISIELLISNAQTSLIESGVDVAIRSGALQDSSHIVKKLALSSILTVATPAYLQKHGVPVHPKDLVEHQTLAIILQGSVAPWNFENQDGIGIVHHPQSGFRTNDAEQLRIAVLAHLGIANGPAWLFSKEIAAGTLRQLLPDYVLPKSIYAIRPGGRRLATKVRVFIDFFEEVFASEFRSSLPFEMQHPEGRRVPPTSREPAMVRRYAALGEI